MKSLAHSRWECKSHVGFIPKYRRKAIYGEVRQLLGEIFHELARQKECRIVEGHLLPDPVHMCLEIPPKPAVASGIGFLKGKSALAIARRVQEKDRNFVGEHFWARGYASAIPACEEKPGKWEWERGSFCALLSCEDATT
jgi:putative transposase